MKKASKKNEDRKREKAAKQLVSGTVSKEIVNLDGHIAPPAKCGCPPGCVDLPCCN